MSNEKFKIPRASDRMIVDVFREMGKQYSMTTANVTATTGINLVMDLVVDTISEELTHLLELDSSLIETVHVQHHQMAIVYNRGGALPAEQKSPVFDEIVISFSDGHQMPTVADRLGIVALLHKKFKRVEIGQISASDVSPEISHVLAIHQSNLARLEQLNEDLIERTASFRDDLERKYQEKVEKYNAELAALKLEVGNELQLEKASLETRERAVEEKLSTIDDRNNTHVRREIRDRMLDDVKQRIQDFGVSKATSEKRQPVMIGMLSLGILNLVFIGWTIFEIKGLETIEIASQHASAIYWLWARLALLTLSLLGTIVYYIKWQNKWAEQHSVSEFQLQQFYIDVNRANWVIESCLEWRKETDSAIPKELLSSIANGLFVNSANEPEHVLHPADELASALMGSASKLRLKVGDGELEFDKPGKITKKTSVTAE